MNRGQAVETVIALRESKDKGTKEDAYGTSFRPAAPSNARQANAFCPRKCSGAVEAKERDYLSSRVGLQGALAILKYVA